VLGFCLMHALRKRPLARLQKPNPDLGGPARTRAGSSASLRTKNQLSRP
jgi:hypothetical protein